MKKLIIAGVVMFCFQIATAQLQQENAYTDSLQHVLQTVKNDTIKIKTLSNLADAFTRNNSTIALKYASQCLQLSQQKKWQKGIGLAYRALGTIYYTLSDYSNSLEYFKKASAVFQLLQNEPMQARLFSNIGDVYGSTGLYTQSLENYISALRLFEI